MNLDGSARDAFGKWTFTGQDMDACMCRQCWTPARLGPAALPPPQRGVAACPCSHHAALRAARSPLAPSIW